MIGKGGGSRLIHSDVKAAQDAVGAAKRAGSSTAYGFVRAGRACAAAKKAAEISGRSDVSKSAVARETRRASAAAARANKAAAGAMRAALQADEAVQEARRVAARAPDCLVSHGYAGMINAADAARRAAAEAAGAAGRAASTADQAVQFAEAASSAASVAAAAASSFNAEAPNPRAADAEEVQPLWVARRITRLSVRLLSAEARTRHEEDLLDELFDLVDDGSTRRAQVACALRQLLLVWELRASSRRTSAHVTQGVE